MQIPWGHNILIFSKANDVNEEIKKHRTIKNKIQRHITYIVYIIYFIYFYVNKILK